MPSTGFPMLIKTDTEPGLPYILSSLFRIIRLNPTCLLRTGQGLFFVGSFLLRLHSCIQQKFVETFLHASAVEDSVVGSVPALSNM